MLLSMMFSASIAFDYDSEYTGPYACVFIMNISVILMDFNIQKMSVFIYKMINCKFDTFVICLVLLR